MSAPCAGTARYPAVRNLLVRLLGWIRQPPDYAFLDNFNDHTLRDIGIEPDGRKDQSNVGFWRPR